MQYCCGMILNQNNVGVRRVIVCTRHGLGMESDSGSGSGRQ